MDQHTPTNSNCIIILLIIALAAFGLSLANGFIGDDISLFGANTFYKDTTNIRHVLTGDFVMSPDDLTPANPNEPPSYSGCVAYRPVTALSFFVDRGLWGAHAYGYHISNLLLHASCAIALFFLLVHIFKNNAVALLAASIFTAHPIQVESVNSIGLRSDLLAAFFSLIALNMFMRILSRKQPVSFYRWGFVAFAFALLSKETAVMLPVVLIAYQLINWRIVEKRGAKHIQIGSWILLVGYAYLYFFKFPNTTLQQDRQLFSLEQLPVAGKAILGYLKAFTLPNTVSVLPSFQPLGSGIEAAEITALVIILAVITGAFILYDARKTVFFVMLSLLMYLPTANIMAMPTPFAYRFFYFPSIGLSVVTALFLWGCFERFQLRPVLRAVIAGAVIILLASFSAPLNRHYKNNLMYFHKIIDDHPKSVHPYLILGSMYKQKGELQLSEVMFKMYLHNKPEKDVFGVYRPREEILLQIGSLQPDPGKAIYYFKQALELNPHYAKGYAQLARAYTLQQNYRQARIHIARSLELDPKLYTAYVYGIELYRKVGDETRVSALKKRAARIYPGDPRFRL